MSTAAQADDPAHYTVSKPSVRYQSLDTWRGIACLMVLVFHASFYQFAALRGQTNLSGLDLVGKLLFTAIGFMWIGVPIFFVISGYCITATCESSRTRAAGIASYFYRRYRRIFPPFWSIAIITALIIIIASAAGLQWIFVDRDHPIPHPTTLQWTQWLGNLTLTESWRYLIKGPEQLYFLTPAWSLCYEEQFYVVCGTLMFLFPGRFFRGVAIITLLVGIVAIACRSRGWVTDGFFFDGRWFLFSGGILVYWLIHGATSQTRDFVKRALIFTSILVVGSWLMPYTQAMIRQSVSIMETSFALWATTALVLLHKHDKQIHTSRLLLPITKCGSMCYSVYLVHWPVVKVISNAMWQAGVTSWIGTLFLTIPLCTAVSLLLARIFFDMVEIRFLNTAPTTSTVKNPEQAAGTFIGR